MSEEKQSTENKTEVKKPINNKTEKENEPKKNNSKKIPKLKSGMTVRVHEKIKDIDAKGKERTRVQIFEGIILAVKKPNTASGTILVRKISHAGVGVEKIFPIQSPLIDKIEIVKQIRARRSKLYFLRNYKKRLKATREK